MSTSKLKSKLNRRDNFFVIPVTVVCIMINFIGKELAVIFELPVWLDTFGTALAAYALGPICGAIVGATVNIISSFLEPLYMVYALVNVAVGLIVGLCAKKKFLENVFGILTTGFLVTLASVAISTPLNFMFFEGYTGNKWGDGVIDLLGENNIPPAVRYTVGEFYVDFIDKVLVLFALYGVIQLVRQYRGKRAAFIRKFIIYIRLGHRLHKRRINRNFHRKKVSSLFISIFISFILFICFGPSPALAAGSNITVDYNNYLQTIYNDENGLSGGAVNDIAQTDDGVIWIGSYGGLYRHTGTEFQWMNQFESVKNVNCFYVDEEGRLWIGTNDGGLSICIDNTITNVLDEDHGLPSNAVRCITMCANGNYYVGTTGPLAIVSLSGGLSVTAVIPELAFVRSLAADSHGHIAAVTMEGHLYLIEGTEIVYDTASEIDGEIFNCCTFDPEGNLYVGTSGKDIIVYKHTSGEAREILEQERIIHCDDIFNMGELKFDPNGQLIICAFNGIGFLTKSGLYHRIRANNFSNSVVRVIFDYQGNLWFASSKLGLLKLCESHFTEIYSKVGIPGSQVNTITRWQGNFYFGTDNGLTVVDRSLTKNITENSKLAELLKGEIIRCLRTDSKNNLWICTTRQGLWQVTPFQEIKKYTKENGALEDRFRSTIELRYGTIAAASNSGITFIKDGQVINTIKCGETGHGDASVLCMLEVDDRTLFAGTDGNGIQIIESGQIVKTLGKNEGLTSKVVMRIVKDPKDEGFFVVTSNALCFMDNNYNIRPLTSFPYYNNFEITVGMRGELLVSSSAGIYVVDRDALLSGHKLEYTLLNSQKGLRAPLTAIAWNYIDEEHNLYLGTNDGVAMVNLERYNTLYKSYRMSLKSMTVDDEVYSVELSERLRIPRGAKRITLSPEIRNYSPSNPYVSLYLDGFDSAPRVMPSSELRDVVYTNLPTGNYTFHFAILDENSKIASENTYLITKEKEIYDEIWFLAYVIFVFVFTIVYLTWLLFRTQIQRSLNIQKRELELAQRQVKMGNEAILTIARTVDAKDANTSQHSFRVSEYSVMIAKRLGFTEEMCDELRRTALLHDIGKIGIPDGILNKPAKLTDEEYAQMKSHVIKGGEILKDFTSVEHIVEGAQFHHERWDGRGYAQGLKGEDIPLYARIIGIADAFDAMTANRVYRKRLDMDYVLGELKRGRGTQFDPKLADIFLSLIDDGTVQIEKLYEESQTHKGRVYTAQTILL